MTYPNAPFASPVCTLTRLPMHDRVFRPALSLLERLPPDYRQVVILRHIEQLTFGEIADRMDRTVTSVRSIWPRALAQLRRQLGQ